MYLSPGKFFRNQILLDYLGRWRNQSCQIFIQSVHSGVSGKGSNFAIFSANRRCHYNCCTTVQLWYNYPWNFHQCVNHTLSVNSKVEFLLGTYTPPFKSNQKKHDIYLQRSGWRRFCVCSQHLVYIDILFLPTVQCIVKLVLLEIFWK